MTAPLRAPRLRVDVLRTLIEQLTKVGEGVLAGHAQCTARDGAPPVPSWIAASVVQTCSSSIR
jgi:hypothetical protein